MENGDRRAPSQQQWLKWPLFATSWCLCLLILIFFATNNGLHRPCDDSANQGLDFRPLRNEIKGFSYTYKECNRPVYSVRVAHLRAENNNFGIFKTGLHKVIKIQDLQLAFHRYTTAQVASTPTCSDNKSSDTVLAGSRDIYPASVIDICSGHRKTDANVRTVVETARRLLQRKDRWRLDVDFSNASEILINNFEYRVFCDENPSLSVRSARLMVGSDQPEIILRGHVRIEAPDGSTLESNYVRWDVANQRFTAKGGYVLNRNGNKKTGKDICVNAQLNQVNIQQAKFEGKEKTECFANL